MTNPSRFFDAMLEKFHRRGKEHDRSLEPWKDYSVDFLADRLREEIGELVEASGFPLGSPVWDERFLLDASSADELLDVANFLMFLWVKWNQNHETM